jgi:hypothetical protein
VSKERQSNLKAAPTPEPPRPGKGIRITEAVRMQMRAADSIEAARALITPPKAERKTRPELQYSLVESHEGDLPKSKGGCPIVYVAVVRHAPAVFTWHDIRSHIPAEEVKDAGIKFQLRQLVKSGHLTVVKPPQS